ncbi:MAG: hypothetical protein B7Z14_13610 [Bosea sp. 32-68-6]|nr:MAG: hypothetical protein B7Z14_13610 [Bosea sp. 32-68-6]
MPGFHARSAAPFDRGRETDVAISITGGDILGEGLERRDLAVADGLIAAFDTAPRAGALRLDATGLLVLPGLVDCHGDAFERHVMPRPRVAFDIDLALKDADRALLANGITTAFHGVTWSWEPGLRGAQNARALAESIDKLQPELGADTRFHLRHETFNLDAEPQILDWLAQGRIGVLAFNDHTEGTLKTRHRPDKIGKMVERTGLSTEAFMALVETVYARKSEVEGSIARLAAAARAAGVTMFSHDDMTPDMRAWYRSLGVTVAEFPIDEATARAASTILASDYYYPALALAPFLLARRGAASFAEAWALVSRAPAQALRLDDRGVIAPGKRADLVLVEEGPHPRIVATIAAGRLVHLADQRLLG